MQYRCKHPRSRLSNPNNFVVSPYRKPPALGLTLLMGMLAMAAPLRGAAAAAELTAPKIHMSATPVLRAAPKSESEATTPSEALGAATELPPAPSSASALLFRAFDYFRAEQDSNAVDSFQAAVATGNLNNAGRALAYWHIFAAQQHLGNDNQAAEALGSFVVVAQDVLNEASNAPPDSLANNLQDDFIQRFDLPQRLARARATLSAVWTAHTQSCGRQRSQPILVHNDIEKDYFLLLTVPCPYSQDRQVKRSDPLPPASPSEPPIEEVHVFCSGTQTPPQSYYFQTISDDTPP